MSSNQVLTNDSLDLATQEVPAITVDGLGKCFHIYERPRQRLQQLMLAPIQSKIRSTEVKYYREFWALKNINFRVNRGETVGIIGKNGSGKSTLLQIICGTLAPSTGSVTVNGRVAALLELGSGFNPEFTGRENVYLNGTILGLSRKEIDDRFSEIEAFADIGDFIDQQVKSYSSGMGVRLAFAVAINADPEILIVDEALSVGDELFQRKCFSRIEAIRKNGATILFVSHSGSAIVDLCDRAVLLDSGDMLTEGEPKVVVGSYQKMLYAPADRRAAIRDQISSGMLNDENTVARLADSNSEETAEDTAIEESFDEGLKPNSTIEYQENGARIRDAGIYTSTGVKVNNLVRGRTYSYRYNVDFSQSRDSVRFSMLIKTITGTELGGAMSAASVAESIPTIKRDSTVEVQFNFTCNLTPGVYFLNAGVSGIDNEVETFLHRALDVAAFRVMNESGCLATSLVDFHCVPTFNLKGQ